MHNGFVEIRTGAACKGAPLLLAALLVAGCSKESKPVAEQPKVAPASDSDAGASDQPQGETPSEAANGAAPVASAKAPPSEVKTDIFALTMQPSGAYKAGEAGRVDIVLEAKPPFKVNQEYPYSFALNETQGLSFASKKVQKDAVKLEHKRATMAVPFTAEEAGKHTISGTFKFSVCTEEQCLIKKEDLALAVDVN